MNIIRVLQWVLILWAILVVGLYAVGMPWRFLVGWSAMAIIISAPVVQLIFRHRDDLLAEREAREINYLRQQVSAQREELEMVRKMCERIFAQLDIWADTWGQPADEVRARLQAARKALS